MDTLSVVAEAGNCSIEQEHGLMGRGRDSAEPDGDANAAAEAGEVAGDTGTAAGDVGVVADAAGDEGTGAGVVGAGGGVVGASADEADGEGGADASMPPASIGAGSNAAAATNTSRLYLSLSSRNICWYL